MCSAKEFFEKLSSEELSEFLTDTFDRHSHGNIAELSEHDHIVSLGNSIECEFAEHPGNKTLSHETWAIATLRAQFRRNSGEATKMPEMLGPDIYNNPVFTEAFLQVRESMRNPPELKRA